MFPNRLCVVVGSAACRPHDRVPWFCLVNGELCTQFVFWAFPPSGGRVPRVPHEFPRHKWLSWGWTAGVFPPRSQSQVFLGPQESQGASRTVPEGTWPTARNATRDRASQGQPGQTLVSSRTDPGKFQHKPSHPLASLLPGDVVLRSTRLGSRAPRGNVHAHTDYKYTCFSLHSFGGAKFRKPHFYFS